MYICYYWNNSNLLLSYLLEIYSIDYTFMDSGICILNQNLTKSTIITKTKITLKKKAAQ